MVLAERIGLGTGLGTQGAFMLRPPARLRSMRGGRALAFRYFWLALFGFALVVVALATAYTLRAQ